MKAYFFDTYALIEIFKGNENYRDFAKCNIITSYLNLFELYYNLIKSFDREKSRLFFDRVKNFCVALDEAWILQASEMKIQNKTLSYADCLGYVIAKNTGLKFLTGDNQFKELSNVEFCK